MPNRILPDFWRYEPEFNRLRVHTREFLFRLVLGMDDYWRCFVGTSPQSPEFLRSTLYPLNLRVRVSDIASYLTEAQAAGVILIRDSDRGWYVEVAERYRYRKEDHAEGQPKFGPRLVRTPAQSELHLGPVALPPAQTPARGRKKRTEAPIQDNRIPDEVADDESARERTGSRDLSILKDSSESLEMRRKRGDFCRVQSSRPNDDVWRDVCRFFAGGDISCPELWNNGAQWLARLDADRPALAEAIQEARMHEKEGFDFGNKGAWLTDQFNKCTRKSA